MSHWLKMAYVDPTAPVSVYPDINVSYNYRHHEVQQVKDFFEHEIEKRLRLYKGYKRLCNALVVAKMLLLGFSLIIGGAGLASLTHVLPPEMAIIFESVSFGLGLLGSIVGFCEGSLQQKVEKHDQIHSLACVELATILDYVSKALDDGQITGEEFAIINGQRRKYIELRKSVKAKGFSGVDAEDLKKILTAELKK